MSFISQSSPHAHATNSTQQVMLTVAGATLPGVVALVYFFGVGVIINLALAITFSVALEACVLYLRKRPIMFYLSDCSALVTALLLGLALPPYCPWWLIFVGCFFSIVVAKQLYGGLGFNPFNPAMVGYVVLLISFPVNMTIWTAPNGFADTPSIIQALSGVFAGHPLDAFTGATPLDAFKQAKGETVSEIFESQSIFSQGLFAGAGWEWVNVGFLLGGLFLLWRKIFSWHAPVAMLSTLAICSILFYNGGSESSAPVLTHLFSGATMLGAFFIITDPVSSAVSQKGRLIFGGCVGILVFMIRHFGNYPDAMAFAVLLMNFAAPFIDYYTLPRSYGHEKARRATEKVDV